MTCSHANNKILESRFTNRIKLGDGSGLLPITAKRRIHKCFDCSHRWTTYELTADALKNLITNQAELQQIRDRIRLIQDALTHNL